MKNNWSDALYGQAVAHFHQNQFKESKACIEKAIRSFKAVDAIQSIDTLVYFRSVVYKKLRKYDIAKRDYDSLQKIMCQEELTHILHFVTGLILLPLNENRREKFNYLENTLKLIKHFKKVQPKPKSKLLSSYINKHTRKLDMEKCEEEIIKLLSEEPFFTNGRASSMGSACLRAAMARAPWLGSVGSSQVRCPAVLYSPPSFMTTSRPYSSPK